MKNREILVFERAVFFVIMIFEKKKGKYHFVGEYKLTETHQNIQPDDNNFLRRVFIFHLTKISDSIELTIL